MINKNDGWTDIGGEFATKMFDCNINCHENMPKDIYDSMTLVSSTISSHAMSEEDLSMYTARVGKYAYTIVEYKGNDTGHDTYLWVVTRENTSSYDEVMTGLKINTESLPFVGGA